jgi:hypothetical protein
MRVFLQEMNKILYLFFFLKRKHNQQNYFASCGLGPQAFPQAEGCLHFRGGSENWWGKFLSAQPSGKALIEG